MMFLKKLKSFAWLSYFVIYELTLAVQFQNITQHPVLFYFRKSNLPKRRNRFSFKTTWRQVVVSFVMFFFPQLYIFSDKIEPLCCHRPPSLISSTPGSPLDYITRFYGNKQLSSPSGPLPFPFLLHLATPSPPPYLSLNLGWTGGGCGLIEVQLEKKNNCHSFSLATV